jgi:hypothetical protein
MTSRPEELIAYFGMKPLPVEETYFINTYISDAKTAEGGPAGTAGLGLYLTAPRSASRLWCVRTRVCWPTRATNCARRWPAYAWVWS